jgi:hypothetical protein
MKKYLAVFFVVSAVASAAFASQADYDKCLKKCAKIATTPEDKALCPKLCELYLQDD